MTDTNAIVEKMKATPVRMSMYTFTYGIANIADPKVKDAFVEAYLKTFICELYGAESDEFRAEAVREMKDHILTEIKNRQ